MTFTVTWTISPAGGRLGGDQRARPIWSRNEPLARGSASAGSDRPLVGGCAPRIRPAPRIEEAMAGPGEGEFQLPPTSGASIDFKLFLHQMGLPGLLMHRTGHAVARSRFAGNRNRDQVAPRHFGRRPLPLGQRPSPHAIVVTAKPKRHLPPRRHICRGHNGACGALAMRACYADIPPWALRRRVT